MDRSSGCALRWMATAAHERSREQSTLGGSGQASMPMRRVASAPPPCVGSGRPLGAGGGGAAAGGGDGGGGDGGGGDGGGGDGGGGSGADCSGPAAACCPSGSFRLPWREGGPAKQVWLVSTQRVHAWPSIRSHRIFCCLQRMHAPAGAGRRERESMGQERAWTCLQRGYCEGE